MVDLGPSSMPASSRSGGHHHHRPLARRSPPPASCASLTSVVPALYVNYYTKEVMKIVEGLKDESGPYRRMVMETIEKVVSREIRKILTERARNFNIALDDVSITSLSFGREFTHAIEAKLVAAQEAERAKFIVEKAVQDKKSAIIRSQVGAPRAVESPGGRDLEHEQAGGRDLEHEGVASRGGGGPCAAAPASRRSCSSASEEELVQGRCRGGPCVAVPAIRSSCSGGRAGGRAGEQELVQRRLRAAARAAAAAIRTSCSGGGDQDLVQGGVEEEFLQRRRRGGAPPGPPRGGAGRRTSLDLELATGMIRSDLGDLELQI